jgi:hypothetical protein
MKAEKSPIPELPGRSASDAYFPGSSTFIESQSGGAACREREMMIE